MITVTISINAQPIYTRTAVNVEKLDNLPGAPDLYKYKLDDGSELRHVREDGAVALAIEMLKTIKEVR